MKIKLWQFALVLIGALLVGIGGTLLFAQYAPERIPILRQTPAPEPDIPRYTAGQVIAVARAYSPGVSRALMLSKGCGQELAWSARYLSQGSWFVCKYCIHRWSDERVLIDYWFFHEDTAQLNKSRY